MVSDDSQAEIPSLKQVIEAILYLKGEPLDLVSLAQFAQCQKEEAYKAVQALIQDYAQRDSALEILALDKRFALQLRRPFSRIVNEVFPPELGVGALRTLATIVLKGPLSQADLVDLRGPSAYAQVAELVEKGFVVKYRRQGIRSLWVKVTDKVDRYFSVDELAAAEIDLSLPLTTPDG